MCRSLMPMISAACHHVIFFAMARKITSCTFIAHRGLRVREHACHVLLPSPPEKRTDHVLSQPDISCANDRWLLYPCGIAPTALPCKHPGVGQGGFLPCNSDLVLEPSTV